MIQKTQACQTDYTLAFHCAPVLSGIKPANMVSLQKCEGCGLSEMLRGCASPLNERGVELYPLYESERSLTLLLFRRDMLAHHLLGAELREFLGEYGYAGTTVTELLEALRYRLRCRGGSFPHEIGAFLGYPLGDMRGFIVNKGRRYKLSGYWKVYENPERAKMLFAAYDEVRDFYCGCVEGGEKIYAIQYGGL